MVIVEQQVLHSTSTKKQDKPTITIENAPTEDDKKEQGEESLKYQEDKFALVMTGPHMEEKKKTEEATTEENPEPKEQEAIKSLIHMPKGNTPKKKSHNKKEKSPST